MNNYIFSASRQLMFYVNVGGQSRLVQFGSRNAVGTSVFQTPQNDIAEAIRNHSLFKRGVISEFEQEKPKAPAKPKLQPKPVTSTPSTQTITAPTGDTVETEGDKEVIEAKNFTQAKSLISKRLNIKYGDIKNPDQLKKIAQDAGIILKY